jgi:hypothetical protein
MFADLHCQPKGANQNCCSIKGTKELLRSRHRNVSPVALFLIPRPVSTGLRCEAIPLARCEDVDGIAGKIDEHLLPTDVGLTHARAHTLLPGLEGGANQV